MNVLRRLAYTLRRLFSRSQSVIAALIIAAFTLAALAAPVLSPPRDPRQPPGLKIVGRQSIGVPQPPTADLRLGTTSEQYDVFHALVWGARNALRLGSVVAIVSAVIGTLVGSISGYAGGWLNGIAMRLSDAFLAFPAVIGVLVFTRLFYTDSPEWMVPPTPIPGLLADLGLNPVMVTLMTFSWMPYARLSNATIQQIKHADYVLAARSVGARPRRILFRHLLPNISAPLIVLMARDMGGLVILDAAFSFFQLGGTVEWGQLLASNRSWLLGANGNPLTYWWVAVPFTVALILFGVAWSMLGEGLNEALNPRSRR